MPFFRQFRHSDVINDHVRHRNDAVFVVPVKDGRIFVVGVLEIVFLQFFPICIEVIEIKCPLPPEPVIYGTEAGTERGVHGFHSGLNLFFIFEVIAECDRIFRFPVQKFRTGGKAACR